MADLMTADLTTDAAAMAAIHATSFDRPWTEIERDADGVTYARSAADAEHDLVPLRLTKRAELLHHRDDRRAACRVPGGSRPAGYRPVIPTR